MNNDDWIGVDLDGTLAEYDNWRGIDHIGDPIDKMVKRVKNWLIEDKIVKIFTARVGNLDKEDFNNSELEVVYTIQKWCQTHIGVILPITCRKDPDMVELWDDRCVQVIQNTGEPIDQTRKYF